MIRIILIGVYMFFFSIFTLFAYPVEWVIGKINKKAKDRSSLRIVQGAFKAIRFISAAKTTVIGFEKIPADEPVLFVGNHKSYFDIIIAYSLMPGLTGFVAKKELKKVPVISWWMQNLYCLFLDRDDIKEGLKTILQGIDYIKEGVSIVIFPEGTRAEDDEMLPFHEGSLKFAEKTGCKIIPLVQNNTRACFENNKHGVRKAHTILEFGEPINIRDLSREDKKFLGAYVKTRIEEIYNKNKELV